MKNKTIIFYLILSFIVTSFSDLFCKTIETNDINDLVSLVNEANHSDPTLVLFDIDDTLIESPISLNSGPWISFYWQNIPKLLPHKLPVIEELMWYISKSVPCMAIDPTTASLIANLQKKPSVTPLAFTARPIYKEYIDGIKVTADQLHGIKIDFTQSVLPPSLAFHPSIQAGIIFTSGKMKGEFLQHLLTVTGYLPNRIIFIDDKLDQIESVEKAMRAFDLPVDCLWYRQAIFNRPTFNLQLSNIQLEYLLKYQIILNDDEAKLLLNEQKYFSISPEMFLKDLIQYYEENFFNRKK